MTETSTTATRSGVVAHALHALAQHIDDHNLGAPSELQIEDTHLELHISSHDALAWRTAMGDGVDDIKRERAVRGTTLEWITLYGRLPGSGVRVHVQWIRQLRVVSR